MKKHGRFRGSVPRLVLPVILVAGFFYVSGCSFKEPQAPQWDVNVAIPLIDTTLTIGKLLEDTDDITFDSTGLLGFQVTESMDPVEVGDNLSVEGISENFDVSLGDIRVDSPGSQVVSVQFAAIYPQSVLLDGQTAQVPPFTVNLDKTELPAFGDFESILIREGSVRITLHNNLPIPISSGLGISLYDYNADTLVVSIVSQNELPPNGQITLNKSLANIRLPGHLAFRISGNSPGSGNDSVYVDATNQSVDMEVYVSDIVASEARAKIPDQEFEDTDYTTLGDSIIVTEADISTGSISFQMTNNLPLDLELSIQLLNFFDASGDTFQAHLYLRKGGQTNQYYDLSGYKFRPERTSEGAVVRFHWKAKATGSGDQIITIHANDGIALAVNIHKLAFSKLSGILNQIHITLDSMSTQLDTPKDLEGLQFGDARIELKLINGIGFLIQPTLNIVGTNTHTGQQAALHRTVTIQPAGDQPAITTVILEGDEVTRFLNILPNNISVSGSAILGDGLTESTIRATDTISSQATISIPVNLKFPDQQLTLDPDSLEIDEDAQSEIRDNLNGGSFQAELGNHLPFGASATFYFTSRDTAVYSNPELTIGPITLNPGVTSERGNVVQETPSQIAIFLDKDQLAVFAHPTVVSGIRISLPGSGDKYIRVYRNDYLSAKAFIKINYHVNPEESE